MKQKKGLLFLQGFLFFNLIWYLGAIWLKTPALPVPTKVYGYLPQIIGGPMLEHIGASLQRIFWGLLISTLIGVMIGLLMGTSPVINRLLNPLIYFTYPIPKTALLPILMILFGLGDHSKITLIVLITVFQVIVAVRGSVQQIDAGLYHSMRSLGASKGQMFYHVTLPAVLPDILTHLRLSVGTTLSVLFFAENYGTQHGLGYYIQDSWSRMNYLAMYGGILILGLLGFMLFIMIDGVEQWWCKK
ncbi:ABC transporter permease [Cellulosilyticum sp. ST5]|uniref:ABC transporter permease n=1 Tax=unclassified Cellulosilyticum TaxID=2643091 RepID=UPI000F8E8C6C|nr:ABC transporter permease [Cellulosilyticum sp. WCF-2]QEH69654.1 ABC transporter permease [Cellulosilyticum sp. WCF-2]